MRDKETTITRLIEDAIDKGAKTVEDVHKSIAALPLKILEQNDLLRGPAKEVRRVQDQTIGAVYDLIRDINREVGTFSSELLGDRGKAARPKTRSTSRKTSTPK